MDKNQLTILINLAGMDGEVDESERRLIMRIAHAHGLSEEDVAQIFELENHVIDFDELSDDQRFDTLHHLVQLMKVDGKIFDEEISYCMAMAKKLGYPLEAVMDLYSQVHANVKLKSEIQKIKKKYHGKG